MKLERLNENKIRVILNSDDMLEKKIDLHTFLSNSPKSQEIFLDMLDKAEKELGFITENYKVMIEALATSTGGFVLTITRVVPEHEKSFTPSPKKRFYSKRKVPSLVLKNSIYCFASFDLFCDFCKNLKKLNSNLILYIESFSDCVSLIVYKDMYYLIVSNFDVNNYYDNELSFSFLNNLISKQFCSAISEFGNLVSESVILEGRLKEFGNNIFSENAISECLKYF